MGNNEIRFASLGEYVEQSGMKKFAIAAQLGISRYQMSALLHPDRYAIRVDDALADKIAKLLNQPKAYVRRIYPVAA